MRMLLIVLLGITLFGCQSETIKNDRAGRISVGGKLLSGGQPLQVEGREIGIGRVEIQFYELDDSGALVDNDPEDSTTVEEDGSFTVPAGGLLPGKYRLAVFQFDPDPTDKLGGKFSKDKSPIVIEINGDWNEEIDLSSY